MKIWNGLTKQLEDFEPLEEGKVRMYNCGPTVYKRQLTSATSAPT